MGQVFLSAKLGGIQQGSFNPGLDPGATKAIRDIIWIRDLVAGELRSRGLTVYAVPDDFNADAAIDWINRRCRITDVALELQMGQSLSPTLRGVTVFHIGNNAERKRDSQLLLRALLRRVPNFMNRGIQPDTEASLGYLSFCRQVVIPSLAIELGYLSNTQDQVLIQTQRRAVAQGLAEGIARWLNQSHINPVSILPPPAPIYAAIGIHLNGKIYPEQGLLIHGNPYIPIDLVDCLGIDLSPSETIRRVRYRQIVYVRAIDLTSFGIQLSWDNLNPILVIRSTPRYSLEQRHQIMGVGRTQEQHLNRFIKSYNPTALYQFPQIVKLYLEDAAMESINHDIAFCQMCLETEFLRFGGEVRPSQNNFAGLGHLGGSSEVASFSSIRMGVRAHIQHLKAYACREPLVQVKVDPRFDLITRGIAPSILQLSGRWSEDLSYGDRIRALIERLYQKAIF